MGATGKVNTSRKRFSEVVKGISQFESENGVNFHYARIGVTGLADGDVDVMGVPILWDNAAGTFKPITGAGTAVPTTTRSTLPNGVEFAVIVGDKIGKGVNEEDVTLATASEVELTVLFRGDAAVVKSGLAFDAGADAATKDNFYKALEIARIAVVDDAPDADTFHIAG
jgi:hypothetical protein